MDRISNDSNRQVTFSKRRTGLFKKASEICTMCDATCAIVVFASNDKPYSYVHPSVELSIDRYLGVDPPVDANAAHPSVVAHRNASADRLNNKLNKLVKLHEDEKKYGKELKAMRKEPPNDELDLLSLTKLCEALEAADKEVERVVNHNKELGIKYPYQTLGSAFAPLRAEENILPDSDSDGDGLSDSDGNGDGDEGSSDSDEVVS